MVMDTDKETIRRHMLVNKDLLLTKIDSINNILDNELLQVPVNFDKCSKLYIVRKKYVQKLTRLQSHIKELAHKNIKKEVLTHNNKNQYWYSEVPHIDNKDVLIVAGKNSKMSDKFKKKLHKFNKFYHILNSTGGSILIYNKTTNNIEFYDQICCYFALIFSKFWSSSFQNLAYVSVAAIQNVKPLKKSGAYTITQSENVLISFTKIPLYYNLEKGLNFYEFKTKPVGFLVRGPEPLYKSLKLVLKKVAKSEFYNIHLKLALIILPQYGQIINES